MIYYVYTHIILLLILRTTLWYIYLACLGWSHTLVGADGRACLATVVPTSGESRLTSATSPNFSFGSFGSFGRSLPSDDGVIPACLSACFSQSVPSHAISSITSIDISLLCIFSLLLSYITTSLLKCWWILSLVACFHLSSYWY